MYSLSLLFVTSVFYLEYDENTMSVQSRNRRGRKTYDAFVWKACETLNHINRYKIHNLCSIYSIKYLHKLMLIKQEDIKIFVIFFELKIIELNEFILIDINMHSIRSIKHKMYQPTLENIQQVYFSHCLLRSSLFSFYLREFLLSRIRRDLLVDLLL